MIKIILYKVIVFLILKYTKTLLMQCNVENALRHLFVDCGVFE